MDALIRLQGFELFCAPHPFGRDLTYLARTVAAGRLDPQVVAERSWHDVSAALDQLGRGGVEGKLVLTLDR